MPFQFADIPDLAGSVAIVTGGNAGIGEVCSRELAKRGCKVYVFTRSQSRYDEFMIRMETKADLLPEERAKISFVHCDLSDLESVKQAVESFKAKESTLNILLNNAGVMAMPYSLTKQGIEIQNGTNVVGHTLLSFLLLDTLVSTSRKSSPSVRVVQLSSGANQLFGAGPPKYSWESLERVNENLGSTWKRYGKSKVGNILLANELKKITSGENIAHISLDPGVISTGLYAGLGHSYGFLGRMAEKLTHILLLTPEKGALSSLYAATSPEVDSKNLNGAFLAPMAKVGKAASWSQDHDGSYGASMIHFVKTFCKEKASVDIDELVKHALER